MSEANVVMAAARARKRIVSDFVAAGATVADRAIAYQSPVDDAGRLMFRKLTRFGAIVEVSAGTYWLDPARLAAFRRATRRRALSAVAMLGAVAAAAFVLGE